MKCVRINQIAFLAAFAVLFPAFGKVYYFSGNGATNERGYLISDKANWQDLASMPPADADILGLRNVSGKTCVLSLNADLTIGRWSVEDNNGKNLAFDFSPYTFEATGICSGGSNQGNQLTLKSGVLKCGTLNVPHSGAMRDNVFIAKGVNSSVLVKTFGMTKGTNNVFCVCGGAAFGNYRDASQDLKLFNDASIESYRNVFCVSNATVRNYKTIQLNGGRENTVRLENVTFLDLSNAAMTPGFSFTDGQNNVLELIRQDVVVENNADLAIFGNNTIGCKVQIAGGASLMHTNWNKQVQVGANSTTAISNFVHVTGAGSTLGYNGAIILGKHYAPYSGLLVEDGGAVKYVQSSGGGGGTTYIGQGASHGNWVRVEGAGSVFAPANVTMGCGDKADTALGVAYGNENKLTISRGATATVSALQVGFFNASSEISLGTLSCSNRVEILDGAVYEGKSVSYAGHDSFFVVSNASVSLTGVLRMPQATSFTEDHARDMHVVLGGTNTQVTAVGDISFERNTDFVIRVPETGLDRPLFKSNGNITFGHCGGLSVEWPSSRETEVVVAQAGGTLTVDAASLAAMRASLPGNLKLKVSGNSLVIGKKNGLLLIFR